MTVYLALVDEGPEGFGVVVPDCLGCHAAGTDLDDAIGNAAEVLTEWMADHIAAGLPQPRPRTYRELRADPALAEDFAADVIVVAIPLTETSMSDDSILTEIDAAARRNGISRSAFLAAVEHTLNGSR